MNIDINCYGGLISLGPCSILWENALDDLPGFLALSSGEYSLEIGEIDNGNGIFITKYKDEDIEYSKPLIQF